MKLFAASIFLFFQQHFQLGYPNLVVSLRYESLKWLILAKAEKSLTQGKFGQVEMGP